jgi:hypothetical protein
MEFWFLKSRMKAKSINLSKNKIEMTFSQVGIMFLENFESEISLVITIDCD